MVCSCFAIWVYNLTVEWLYVGLGTLMTKHIYNLGFYLFIFVELMFFFSFFYTYFSVSTDMYQNTGFSWPPLYLNALTSSHIDIVSILNIILVGSSLLLSTYYVYIPYKRWLYALITTVISFGTLFGYIQYMEYTRSTINIANTVYASVLYAITGLHTIHVFIGIILFIFLVYKLARSHFTLEHTFSLIVAVYYWHFVDIVWIFVYITQFIHSDFYTVSYLYLIDMLDFKPYVAEPIQYTGFAGYDTVPAIFMIDMLSHDVDFDVIPYLYVFDAVPYVYIIDILKPF